MDKNDIKKSEIRAAIDLIDDDIVNLLTRRIKLVKQIALYKTKGKITDKKREEEIMSKIKYKASMGGVDEKYLCNIFELILINSRQEQKKIIK